MAGSRYVKSGNYIHLAPALWRHFGAVTISSPGSSTFRIPSHWWGKIIGALLGLLKGGLSGALLGALAGHMVDRLLLGFTGKSRTREVFFNALFATLGHLCKADGRVTQAEIVAAEGLMHRLELDADERQHAIAAFNAGKSISFDMEAALHDFTRYTVVRQDLRQMFMEILLEGAAVDGRISQSEHAVLVRAAQALHIPANAFAAMLHAFGAGHGPGPRGGSAGTSKPSLAQDFATLGLPATAGEAEIKRAYRKLISQYHPDRLVSRGLPEGMMEKAKDRVREINAAYDRLKQARGIK
jgi:DnaJ like chaperone protein